MRKLLKELFYVPKYGKVREKVVLVRAATTAMTMIACLAAMSLAVLVDSRASYLDCHNDTLLIN